MAYKMVDDFATPDEALERIRDYFKEIGWTILCDCEKDMNIDDDIRKATNIDSNTLYDGRVLAVRNKDSTVYGSFRSMNGYRIFKKQVNDEDGGFHGIGFTGHTDYKKGDYWFEQPESPIEKAGGTVPGVGMIMRSGLFTKEYEPLPQEERDKLPIMEEGTKIVKGGRYRVKGGPPWLYFEVTDIEETLPPVEYETVYDVVKEIIQEPVYETVEEPVYETVYETVYEDVYTPTGRYKKNFSWNYKDHGGVDTQESWNSYFQMMSDGTLVKAQMPEGVHDDDKWLFKPPIWQNREGEYFGIIYAPAGYVRSGKDLYPDRGQIRTRGGSLMFYESENGKRGYHINFFRLEAETVKNTVPKQVPKQVQTGTVKKQVQIGTKDVEVTRTVPRQVQKVPEHPPEPYTRNVHSYDDFENVLGDAWGEGYDLPDKEIFYEGPKDGKRADKSDWPGYSIKLRRSKVPKDYIYKLYFNHVEGLGCESVLITLVWYDKFYQHICLGHLDKVGKWKGGMFFSGTLPSADLGRYNTFKFYENFDDEKDDSAADLKDYTSIVTPIFSERFGKTNTFLRLDMDAVPRRDANMLWASNGPPTASPTGNAQGYTGLLLVTPNLLSSQTTLVEGIPHYGYASGFLDEAKAMWPEPNNNELNGITINFEFLLYVIRDPWTQGNFSPVGFVPGVYAISLAAVAAAKTYGATPRELGVQCQAFPHTERPTLYGYFYQERYAFRYTGISVEQ